MGTVSFSHFDLLLQNHLVPWNQISWECSLDDPLQNLLFFVQMANQDGCYHRNKSGMFIVQLILMIFFFYVAYEIFILKYRYANKFTSIWLLLFSIYYSSVKMWPTLKFWTFLLHATLIWFLYFMCSWNRFVLALYDFGDKKIKVKRNKNYTFFVLSLIYIGFFSIEFSGLGLCV